ncbi:MAG: SAM-dependent methyltransferase [Bdellovibrionota bacterium]
MESSAIRDVSDTALWVAYHRAEETERRDALFNDPYAKTLAGERGALIAKDMAKTAKFSRWNVAIRTYLIDRWIRSQIADGIDTFLNLGSGLDTRPYRMGLPDHVQWIEADLPGMIDYKEAILQNERPTCRLQRCKVDLAKRDARRAFLAEVAAQSRNILVLTEGVIPYLTIDEVSSLGSELRNHDSFRFWIAEYFSKRVYRYLDNPHRRKRMRNAPFRFFPDDWFGCFREMGWEKHEIRYLSEESLRLGRPIPTLWFLKLLQPFLPETIREANLHLSGYVLFEPLQSPIRE